MDLTNINHKTYPRAVEATAEGHLRPAASTQRPSHTHQGTHTSMPARKRAAQHAEVARQYQEQRADQWGTGGQRSADEAGSSGFGDQLAAASRQARQSHVRRRYSPPALISARGHEANRRYLDTSLSSQPRIIDEVV